MELKKCWKEHCASFNGKKSLWEEFVGAVVYDPGHHSYIRLIFSIFQPRDSYKKNSF